MVGMRHPVRWFESFYNYRIQNGILMPPMERMKPRCAKGQYSVCIDRGWFHVNLAAFGKTNLTEEELDMFSERSRKELTQRQNPYTPNKVFLYDTAQLADKEPDRIATFRHDLGEYIGLTNDLPPALHVTPGHSVNATEQALRNSRKVDICDEKYTKQRLQLVTIGTEIRNWLQKYFLKSPDIIVSNREHFDEILESYAVDPCEAASAVKEQHRIG